MTLFQSGILSGVGSVRRVVLTVTLLAAFPSAQSNAQPNSWTKPVSGSWEEPAWSAGILPGPGQSIYFTNAGWKALMISSGTAQIFPSSMTVESITISAPTNTFNTLLLNHAGFLTPLTVKSLIVGSNCGITMISSALHLNGPTGVGMSIGGEFNQSDGSYVFGNQLDVGYNGPGVYHLQSGVLDVGHAFVGGPYGGGFNQSGGTNLGGIVHLAGGAQYSLTNGEFAAEIYFNNGTLHQQGGRVTKRVTVFQGQYVFEGGINEEGASVPITAGGAIAGGFGIASQTGGTNYGSLDVGWFGYGSYTLYDGLSMAPWVRVGPHNGGFHQLGGTQIIDGSLTLASDYIDRNFIGFGSYVLADGFLSCSNFYSSGSYAQSGGTHIVRGDIELLGTHNYFYLSGGFLAENNLSVGGPWVGQFEQSGGIHFVTNTLTVHGSTTFGWDGVRFTGGLLTVSNIFLNYGSRFHQSGGTLVQSGRLTMLNASIGFGGGDYQLGPLQIEGFLDSQTNSTLTLSSNSTIVRFGSSSGFDWDGPARLIVRNWMGSSFGEGTHRIIFGNGATALTLSQLNQILFENPSGFDPGLYPARILESGEIVPRPLSPTGNVPAHVFLQPQTNRSMRVIVQGIVDGNYGIEVSSNLVNWTLWTNRPAVGGVMSAIDGSAPNHAARFYRAILLP